MKLLSLVVVAVLVPLLYHVASLATCASGRPRSVADEVPVAVRLEADPSPMGRAAPCRPDALLIHAPTSAALMAKNWVWSFARADAITPARAPRQRRRER